MRCWNWKGSAKGIVFPFISSTGNNDLIVHDDYVRKSEMNDERVDLIIELYRKKHDWSKHEWAYQETVQSFESSSAGDVSEQEKVGETGENGDAEEVDSTHVSAKRKGKREFKDVGVESRKKKLLYQRSTDKYHDMMEEMKSYIHGMFKSSFIELEKLLVQTMEDRNTRFEEKVMSLLMTRVMGPDAALGVPASPFTAPVVTFTAPSAVFTAPAAAFTTPTPDPAQSTAPFTAPAAAFTTPTPAPTQSTAPAASRKGAPSTIGGPANAAKTRPLQIGPSKYDLALSSRVMGPDQWFKNYRKSENHLFKWIDEALLDEIRSVDAKQDRVARNLAKFEEILSETVKSERVIAEHEMTQKLKEVVNLEVARVERDLAEKVNEKVKIEFVRLQNEMKKKVKLATMAMVVVGAIVGIWTAF
ncbi:unnamed protein product [Eruca vesicaria subsp. sativa]|uniref:Uncharacterized protein n=1 Tax=Eruca vesicaria subsp. sativa TaxID=29727 RepID=A0ABC8JRY8_ERUVS|nr:unnamed protein product [Eruca vesicaria subsp. sativa]